MRSICDAMPTHRIVISGLLIALVVGCAPTNRDELIKEALAKDPSFKGILDKRKELGNRIETYEQELELKRSTVDRTIKQLRRDLTESVATVHKKIQHAKSQMEPDHGRMNLALSKAGEELTVKRAHRASIGRQMSQLRKSLKAEGMTDADRTRQQQQLDELSADATRVDTELKALQEHVRLLKIKLLLLKL